MKNFKRSELVVVALVVVAGLGYFFYTVLSGSEMHKAETWGTKSAPAHVDTQASLPVRVEPIPKEELQPITKVFFKTKEGKLYFDNGFSSVLYPNSDPDTFEVFPESDYLARDKYFVYSWANIIEGADPKTFELMYPQGIDTLSEKRGHTFGFARDASHVYSFTNRGPTFLPITLEGADPTTLTVLDVYDNFGGVAADKSRLYMNDASTVTVVEGVDLRTVTYLGGGYVKDSTGAYSTLTNRIEGVEPNSFEFLGGAYAKDAKQAYFRGEPMPGVNGASFAMVTKKPSYEHAIAKDNNHVYEFGKPVAGIDASSFEYLTECGNFEGQKTGYYKDKGRVYVNTKVVNGADPGTFKVFDVRHAFSDFFTGVYAKDATHAYYGCGRELSVADPATFEPLGKGYLKDNQNFYQHTDTQTVKIISEADYKP